MTRVWNRLAGAYVAGDYRLDEYLGGDDSAAWYLTMSRSGQRAAIKLIPEDAASRGQLDAWRATRLLSHSNLLPMFDCGHADVEGGVVLYAVFEYPDDNLASALQRGPLEDADARATLAAGLEALRYVHGRGMVHGAVDGQHVLAVGDRVKLASDTLVPLASAAIMPEDDIRALHRLLGFPYAAAPEPPAAKVEAPAPVPEIPEAVEEPVRKSMPKWVFGAAAALVLAIVAFNLKPSGHPVTAAPAAVPPVTAPRAATEPKPSPVPLEEVLPQRAASKDHAVWRVVAYTYNRYRDAEKKARTVNSRWPGLHATVFTPRGKERPPYFVALGGRMTHAEALNLRQVARAKGLPRDTFVRNYSD